MPHRLVTSLLVFLALPSMASSQPAMVTKPTMAVATSPLTLGSEYNHGADILFTVSAGSPARTLCSDATLITPVTTRSIPCGSIPPGSSLTVQVRANHVDRCRSSTGQISASCAGTYATGCIPTATGRSQCRLYGGFSRTLGVTAPLVTAGQPLRLVLSDPTTLTWK
jgi:hypothetical protein